MADQEEVAKRVARLTKLFNGVIHGYRELKTAADGNRFLEALCAQNDASKCVENLIAAPEELNAVAKVFRFQRDSTFLNGPATATLRYLHDPSLKHLYAGQFLHRVLEQIVEPLTFWNTFVEAHHAGILTEDGTHELAWLLHEILCSRNEAFPDVRDVAERVTQYESFINSSSLEVRNIGYKIQHILQRSSTDVQDGPGGRHDNDFADFRKIKILPTSDEHLQNNVPARKKFLMENSKIIKHQSLGCLISNGNIVAFASVDRDTDMLAKQPPVLVLRVSDENSFKKVLLASKLASDLLFVQVDTAVFAYEPILKRLQNMSEVPLQEQLLELGPDSSEALTGIHPSTIINTIRENLDSDLQNILRTTRSVNLDNAQAESLLIGLAKRTFTNHALDQFLLDLQNIGIPQSAMVRIGGRFDASTKHLSISEQQNTYKMSRQTSSMIEYQKLESEAYYETLMKKVAIFRTTRITDQDLLDYLELSDDSWFFDAFQILDSDDGGIVVGKRGRRIDPHYLLKQWMNGTNNRVPQAVVRGEYRDVWKLDPQARFTVHSRWIKEMTEEHVAEVGNLIHKYNQCRDLIDQLFRQKSAHILEQKRIIGCTTTAAAMYTEQLQKVSPGIILVEEAGEILESHVLTAMTPTTKQLVLIGEHKQLRPKVNNYALTMEKGDGYNLNQSLFERLVVAGVPHTTLTRQHRMRPEISSLVRNLTYPELEDAPKTQGRPHLRGLQDDLIFVSHSQPELNADKLNDRRDEGSKSSKENEYEADMVLRFVRYLGQQRYNTDQIVILTPYLGQLFLLLKTLSRDNDPILNDLDSHELIQAGLLTPAAANISKRMIRISTIDNYQGEESDIVIASLTRSNTAGDIGFMAFPQRVNVLLSRARNGSIMIGNADTFMNSRKGKDVWVPLMDQLKREGHVYDGFPVKCEQHPEKKALISKKEQFETVCPDGGCSESWCHDKAASSCKKCEAEYRLQEKKRQRDHRLDQECQAKQDAYAARLAEMREELDHQKRVLKDRAEEQDRQNSLAQMKLDLTNLKEKARNSTTTLNSTRETSVSPPTSHSTNAEAVHASSQTSTNESTNTDNEKGNTSTNKQPIQDWGKSESKDDWEWQKKHEGAENEALDALMEMIGLETVKQSFLGIKSKVDTVVRQDVSLKGERLGAALLGNPGTGKTTVARLYAKFLVEVGALPGDHFIESSGSSLANDGVSACKAHIDKILEEGGGVFFIDEAYQLVSGNSYGGKAVLDYLLVEIENLTGKVVFVLAGYHKQMEAFFAHNPGIPSRIPVSMEFQDYNDQELQQILCHYIDTKYKSSMKVEEKKGDVEKRKE
ncbi:AAA domain-containing protein [Massariosphaeria phaeospora]|uniref:AAA domain-containing protein n=1 Tax=Massariosphaeria phaeospora TaxID=100035 RepID=A0A7C8M563_9PLEO|nr:AAA domain-containing protein [Massariosphaeria phaeospora]